MGAILEVFACCPSVWHRFDTADREVGPCSSLDSERGEDGDGRPGRFLDACRLTSLKTGSFSPLRQPRRLVGRRKKVHDAARSSAEDRDRAQIANDMMDMDRGAEPPVAQARCWPVCKDGREGVRTAIMLMRREGGAGGRRHLDIPLAWNDAALHGCVLRRRRMSA